MPHVRRQRNGPSVGPPLNTSAPREESLPGEGPAAPELLIQGPWQASGPSQALSCAWQMRPLVQGERVRDPAGKLSPSLGKSASPRWERSQPPSRWKAEEGTRLLTPSVPATVDRRLHEKEKGQEVRLGLGH